MHYIYSQTVKFLFYNIHFQKKLLADEHIYVRGAYNKFPDFFRMDTFIDSTHMKL